MQFYNTAGDHHKHHNMCHIKEIAIKIQSNLILFCKVYHNLDLTAHTYRKSDIKMFLWHHYQGHC